MKFIHVADMHLDRSFEGLGKLPNELVEQLVKQNQEMVRQLVDLAIKEQVDLVLIVGDTFHQPLVTIQTQHLFIKELERLNKANIPVMLTFGNHDYYLPEKYWFDFPDNVTIFTTEKVETVLLTTKNGEEIAISGFSYQERWLTNSKVSEFPRRAADVDYHLGLYHGEIGTSQPAKSQSYAPFSLGEMKAKAYDYWALGHIHKPTILSEEPPIIYSGAPLGHTKKEKASDGFVLVELAKEQRNYHWHSLQQVKWLEGRIDIKEAVDLKELLTELEEKVQDIANLEAGISLVSLTLVGTNSVVENSLQQELANGSLLAHLQETIYQKSLGAIWLFAVKREIATEELELPLGVSQALLSQLSQEYLELDEFEWAAEDLYRQKELVNLLEPSEELRAERVAASMSLLQQELGISEDLR